MSATGRAAAIERRAPSLPGMRHGREREKDDFYATPAWCTRAILRRLALRKTLAILDPCCGNGAILAVARSEGYSAAGVEIDPARAQQARLIASVRNVDALDPVVRWRAGVGALGGFHVVTNPPFGLAMPFVEKAIRGVDGIDGAHTIAMLLRLAWLASDGRAAFHRAHPADVYVLPKRPSFSGDGKSDSADYAWFVWSATGGGRWEILNLEGSET